MMQLCQYGDEPFSSPRRPPPSLGPYPSVNRFVPSESVSATATIISARGVARSDRLPGSRSQIPRRAPA
jgi:hypothetical protein